MKNNSNLGIISTTLSAVFTALQTNELFQIIQLILTCVSVLITILYSLWSWYKKAKADGKITIDEIDEPIQILKDGNDSLNKLIDKENEDDK